jgi:hypothetical protein
VWVASSLRKQLEKEREPAHVAVAAAKVCVSPILKTDWKQRPTKFRNNEICTCMARRRCLEWLARSLQSALEKHSEYPPTEVVPLLSLQLLQLCSQGVIKMDCSFARRATAHYFFLFPAKVFMCRLRLKRWLSFVCAEWACPCLAGPGGVARASADEKRLLKTSFGKNSIGCYEEKLSVASCFLGRRLRSTHLLETQNKRSYDQICVTYRTWICVIQPNYIETVLCNCVVWSSFVSYDT